MERSLATLKDKIKASLKKQDPKEAGKKSFLFICSVPHCQLAVVTDCRAVCL